MDQMFCEKNEEKNDFSSAYLILGYEKRPAQCF